MFDPLALSHAHGIVRVEDEKGREYDIYANFRYREETPSFGFRRVKKKWNRQVILEDLPPKLYQRIV